ncbi:hypothetical protein Tco_0156067 [Tanacetum coccineum]
MSKASDDIQERELHQLQLMQENAKESCMISFWLLHSFLQVLSYDESKSRRVSERAFMTLFGQDNETHRLCSLNLDQLQRQFDKDEFQEDKSMAAFWVINNQFQKFIDWQYFMDYDSQMTEMFFAEYTRINVKNSALDVVSSQALDADLVVMESNGTKSGMHDTSSSSGTYITHDVDADIRPVNGQVLSAEDAPEFCEFFEINDLKAQLQAKTTLICNLKNQIKSVKEASNEPKVKHDIDVLKTINIELESSVAKLLAENEEINKENEHLTQTYKDLYDSIKKTRIQTKDHNDSLIAQVNSKTVENADLKAQIQEKVFANVALKNELRKLKGNSVDTKFAKTSILGKSVLQPPRNQSVVRQPNAFKSERPNFTPHYLSKERESAVAKPHHMIAPGSSRYSSNNMVHNHYLEEAKKKTQESSTNSDSSVMPSARSQSTANGS